MNRHDIDIELPPLPKLPMNDPAAAHKILNDYGKACARAAIEPYKQRISELEAQLEAVGAGGVSGQPITGDIKPSIDHDWANEDPAIAFHLIDRYAENWNDAGAMMQAYANAHIEADRKCNDNWRHAVMCAISHNDYETDAPRRVQQALRLLSDAFHGLPFRESIIDDLIADRQRIADQIHKDGFYDGVILGLQAMAACGNAFNADYVELLRSAGVHETVKRAMKEGLYELAGLDSNASEDLRKEIDSTRKEFTQKIIYGSTPNEHTRY